MINYIVFGAVILLSGLNGFFAYKWASSVMYRDSQVRIDAVSTFRNYFLMKVDVKKREMFRQVITPQQRAVELKFLNDLEAQFPDFETLKNTTKPLILESFFVPETIKYLTVAS